MVQAQTDIDQIASIFPEPVEPLFDAAYDVQFGYPGRLTHHIRDIEAAFRDS